ncbi:MAG: acetyltransferase [Pseudomonadota bacterium]
MQHNLLYYVTGSLSFSYIVLTIALLGIPLTITALFKICIPVKSFRKVCDHIMAGIYRTTVRMDDFLYIHLLGIKIEVYGDYSLTRDGQYLIISNHRNWADAFMVQHAVVYQGPIAKFLAKANLIYVPLIGMICWAFDFPMLKRNAKKQGITDAVRLQQDLETIRAASHNMVKGPFALVNFAEGTRYTKAKHAQQNSPYFNLLKPKSGGLYVLLQALTEHLSSVIDITVTYDKKDATFFKVLAGGIKHIRVYVELFEPASLNFESREELNVWLEQCWQKKARRVKESIRE